MFSPEVLNNIKLPENQQSQAVAGEMKDLRRQLYDANVKLDNIRKILEK